MAYTDIDKSDEYFNTVLYTGNNATGHAITGVGFQPDWTWIKERSSTSSHFVNDSVRGAGENLYTNLTSAEGTNTALFTSFDSDGFTIGNTNQGNESGQTYVAWNWLADNTSGSSNTDGSITSTVSANTTSGFSIVSYTGNQTSGATVGHSLGSTPSMIIVKSRDTANSWAVYHKGIGATGLVWLNLNNATYTTSNIWNNTEPSSSVFTLGNNDTTTNKSGESYIAYCFAEKKGFSKFGSYIGNGNADGTFIYTGFKPAFVMTKRSNNTENWYILDNKRSPFNPPIKALSPNLSDAEDTNATGRIQDFLSNGFKLRTSDTAVNGSGDTYIYMAFAENPFVTSTGIAGTAR